MKRIAFVLLVVASAVSAAACAYRMTPVPVAGSGESMKRLAGSWRGDYETVPPGRGGSIVFRLAAGSDTAYGDVMMSSSAPSVGWQSGVKPATPARLPLLLAITFVRVTGGGVEGRLDSYLDPDIGDRVTTRFRGAFANDSTIRGTFATRDMWDQVVRRGTWSVVRTEARGDVPR